jgi:hypothetical protein
MSTRLELQTQLQRLHDSGFEAKLSQQAVAHGFAPEFFFAIASRETNCVNELGDVQNDGPHGVGIVQVDVQNAMARQARDDGSWRASPDGLLAFAAQLLADNLRQARQAFPGADGEQHLKIAASGYNCGMSAAIAGARNCGDSDRRTTGHNYGADVMARMKIFQELMQAVSGQHSVFSIQQSETAHGPLDSWAPAEMDRGAQQG